jgi:hypothetical protein
VIKNIISLTLLTSLCYFVGVSANADPLPSDLAFLEVSVEPELQTNRLHEPTYAINYTVRNVGDEVLTYLRIAIVGRNQDGQIVEITDRQVFYSGSLPQGLRPSDEIVQRHGLIRTNPNEIVLSLELSVIEVQ